MKKYYLISFLMISILAGCMGGPPKPESPAIPLPNQTEIVSIKMIKESAQHQIVGYREDVVFLAPDSEALHRIYYIKDKYLKLLGFVTERGGTYRYDKNGNAEFLNNFPFEIGICKLLKFTGTIYFEDFEALPIIDD